MYDFHDTPWFLCAARKMMEFEEDGNGEMGGSGIA
jgi:hypothetical protein